MQSQGSINIDQNADFRMLAVHNHETQTKIKKMRIFISGLTGVGIEVVKNLILVGPRQVSIYDENIVGIEDIGRNFYLSEKDINKNKRLIACLQELKNLNSNVNVEEVKSNDPAYISQNFDCVVVLDNYDREYLTKLNIMCRERRVGFILGGNLGLYGYTFVDYGNQHIIVDKTGEQTKSIHIAAISQDKRGVVFLDENKKHDLSDGDTLLFKEVKGMTEVNGKEFKIETLSKNSFTIGNTQNYSPYIDGGIAIEVKKPQIIKFNSLQESLSYPYAPGTTQMPICNWEKLGYPEQLHIILNSVYDFYSTQKSLPRPLNKDDSQKLKQYVKNKISSRMQVQGKQFKVDNVEEKLIENVSLFGKTQITACCSFWGGIIAQEVIKFTGKYYPLYQWLHHEYFQVLPQLNVQRSQPQNRYRDYHILFGDEFVKKVFNSNIFVIGSGALGCQFLKMFALMGFSSEKNRKLTCTDDDNIEISNLNRQFLFRKEHIGMNKSHVACSIGRKINESCNFESSKLKVCEDTEEYFDDQYWNNLDLVINAVDNVKARQYIDNKCVWHQKPLFESGTLGTKCHSQIILPHKTITYNDIRDPEEEQIALCTLKSFPYMIEHTIQWARDYFEGMLSQSSSDLVKLCENGVKYIEEIINKTKQNPYIARQRLERLERIFNILDSYSYQACLSLVISMFHDIFYSQIEQLVTGFPEDYIKKEDGKPFWSGTKRFPRQIELNVEDPIHLDVIIGGANILATCIGLPMQNNKNKVAELAKKMKPIRFSKQKIQVDQNKSAKVQFCQEDEEEVKRIKKYLMTNIERINKVPTAIEFEKDDPSNYHIEFLGGVANLRARNYRIQQVDNFKIKLIAGKIIPAIVTTTAVVVGAVCMEIIKHVLNKPMSVFKNVTINLALPLWIYNDLMPATQFVDSNFDLMMGGPIKVIPGKFSKWQKINFTGPLKVEQLKSIIEDKYKFKVSTFYCGRVRLFSAAHDGMSKEKLDQTLEQIFEKVTNKRISKKKTHIGIEVSGSTEDGTDCLFPTIRYKL